MVYILLKYYVVLLRMIFDRCHELHISMNLRMCIFFIPHGNLLGHIVCKEGVLVDPAKFAVILNMQPPTSAKVLRSTPRHIGYYHRFIRRYETITASLDKLLKKFELFQWIAECDKAC
jgi:hypothetical protein